MYTTEAKIENMLSITIDDTLASSVVTWIGWVTEYIDNYTGTSFEGTTEARYFDTNGETRVFIDDLISVTQIDFLDEDGDIQDTLSTNDYWLYPLNRSPKTQIRLDPYGGYVVFPVGSKRLKITGVWGVASTVPADIEWVATNMVADIIRENSDVAKSVNSETLGEYSVSFSNISNKPVYKEILNNYRVPTV